jgi:cytochrome c peroxidase
MILSRHIVLSVFLGLFLSLGWLLTACQQEGREAGLKEPDYFVKMKQPDSAVFRAEVAELGRHLFYDPVLSGDNSVSCATCHQQQRAFSDGMAVSVGIRGRRGVRNSISLANVGYRYKGLFWDGRAGTLEESIVHPLTDHREMDSSWEEVLRSLNRDLYYQDAFTRAFGKNGTPIRKEQVEGALAQFMRSLISADSKFDRVLLGRDSFNELENMGFHIFFDSMEDLPDGECGHCHTDPLFTSLEYANNGIEAVKELKDMPDLGRAMISGKPFDRGRFRIPSLRNVALTAPYMHDGRFLTLEEVVDHYAAGGNFQLNTSPNVRPLKLNDQHKAALIAFLHTLTDTSFIQDKRFSNPFAE